MGAALVYAGLWLTVRWARGLNAYQIIVALVYVMMGLALAGIAT